MINKQQETLHDRATRGEQLTQEEQAVLQNWYTKLDDIESQELEHFDQSNSTATLSSRIDFALVQLESVTHQIRVTIQENQHLREEVVALQHRLVHRMTDHAA